MGACANMDTQAQGPPWPSAAKQPAAIQTGKTGKTGRTAANRPARRAGQIGQPGQTGQDRTDTKHVCPQRENRTQNRALYRALEWALYRAL